MKNYNKIQECYGYRCAECGTEINVELHHKLTNTKINKHLYPLFIDSVFNLIPLCGNFANGCHEKYKHKYKVIFREAKMFEEYLQELKDFWRDKE